MVAHCEVAFGSPLLCSGSTECHCGVTQSGSICRVGVTYEVPSFQAPASTEVHLPSGSIATAGSLERRVRERCRVEYRHPQQRLLRKQQYGSQPISRFPTRLHLCSFVCGTLAKPVPRGCTTDIPVRRSGSLLSEHWQSQCHGGVRRTFLSVAMAALSESATSLLPSSSGGSLRRYQFDLAQIQERGGERTVRLEHGLLSAGLQLQLADLGGL